MTFTGNMHKRKVQTREGLTMSRELEELFSRAWNLALTVQTEPFRKVLDGIWECIDKLEKENAALRAAVKKSAQTILDHEV